MIIAGIKNSYFINISFFPFDNMSDMSFQGLFSSQLIKQVCGR